MQVAEIDVEELARRREQGAVVVDVRTPEEFREVRVPGVVLIPLADLPARVQELPEADELLVICRSGHRSRNACEFLLQQGRQAVNVAGGTLAWVESGRPTESGPAAG